MFNENAGYERTASNNVVFCALTEESFLTVRETSEFTKQVWKLDVDVTLSLSFYYGTIRCKHSSFYS